MALTAAIVKTYLPGDSYIGVFNVTFDNSYPTGGESLTAAMLGVNEIIEVLAVNQHTPAIPTKSAHWDRANKKLIVSAEDDTSGVNAEAGSGSDQSDVVVRVLALVR